MPTNFPGTVDVYTVKVDNVSDVLAADINNVQDAIVAIQNRIGANASGAVITAAGTQTITGAKTFSQSIVAPGFSGSGASLTGFTIGQITAGLGFTPLQQGGGAGQNNSKVYIGWNNDNSDSIRLQIDATNFGGDWPLRSRNGAKLWVSFDAAGNIRGSFNVNSITKADLGVYYINFTNALPDTNYAAVAGGGNGGTFGFETAPDFNYACRIITRNTFSGSAQDTTVVMVSIHR
jgi:hypothetical protein